MEGVAGTRHEQKMCSRNGGFGEKTTEDVRLIAEVRFRDGVVHRLQYQDFIKGGSKGD